MIRSPDSGQLQGRLEGAIAEIGDLLYYCNDIINSGIPALRSIMTKHIMNILVLPLLLPSLRPVEICAIAPSVRVFSALPCISFCVLCRIFLRMCTCHLYIFCSLVRSIRFLENLHQDYDFFFFFLVVDGSIDSVQVLNLNELNYACPEALVLNYYNSYHVLVYGGYSRLMLECYCRMSILAL